MSKKIKFSKLALVLFLTLLIWVWADRALDETRSIYTARIVIGRTRPNLLARFDRGSSIDVNEIVLKGPASKINDMEQMITNDPKKLQFTLSLEQLGIDKAGTYTRRDVREIIKQSPWLSKSGLTIEKCEPAEITINVIALAQKPLDVQCFDEEGLPKELEIPQQVNMFVPIDLRGTTARVDLTETEVQKAIKAPIFKKPYVTLSNGLTIEADKTVEIKLSPLQNTLDAMSVANATLGICLSKNLSNGQYKVEIENEPDILSIDILTTQAAKDAYEEQRYQVMLEVLDSDVATTSKNGSVRRTVYYLLPEDYVRQNQIKLAQEKEEAVFKVIPLSPPPAELP